MASKKPVKKAVKKTTAKKTSAKKAAKKTTARSVSSGAKKAQKKTTKKAVKKAVKKTTAKKTIAKKTAKKTVSVKNSSAPAKKAAVSKKKSVSAKPSASVLVTPISARTINDYEEIDVPKRPMPRAKQRKRVGDESVSNETFFYYEALPEEPKPDRPVAGDKDDAEYADEIGEEVEDVDLPKSRNAKAASSSSITIAPSDDGKKKRSASKKRFTAADFFTSPVFAIILVALVAVLAALSVALPRILRAEKEQADDFAAFASTEEYERLTDEIELKKRKVIIERAPEESAPVETQERQRGTVSEEGASADAALSYTATMNDTLWSIAHRELGDGRRWPSIFALNKDTIRDPDVIIYRATYAIPSKKGMLEMLPQAEHIALANAYVDVYRAYRANGKTTAAMWMLLLLNVYYPETYEREKETFRAEDIAFVSQHRAPEE